MGQADLVLVCDQLSSV